MSSAADGRQRKDGLSTVSLNPGEAGREGLSMEQETSSDLESKGHFKS